MEPFSIVQEFCSGGSLLDWLKANATKSISNKEIFNIVLGIIAGVSHIHAEGIIHRGNTAIQIQSSTTCGLRPFPV